MRTVDLQDVTFRPSYATLVATVVILAVACAVAASSLLVRADASGSVSTVPSQTVWTGKTVPHSFPAADRPDRPRRTRV